eukprot:308211_1
MSVLFRLLSCQHIQNDLYVHYYFGVEQCFSQTWILSLLSLIIILIPFLILFLYLKYKMNENERQNKKYVLSSICKYYRPEYYYWNFVILIRRIIISLLTATFYGIYSKMCLMFILFIFLFIQHKLQPFIVNQGNELELILLMLLIFAVFVEAVCAENYRFYDLAIILLSLLILMPFIMLMFYTYILCKRFHTKDKQKNSTNFIVEFLSFSNLLNANNSTYNIEVGDYRPPVYQDMTNNMNQLRKVNNETSNGSYRKCGLSIDATMHNL